MTKIKRGNLGVSFSFIRKLSDMSRFFLAFKRKSL